MVKRIKKPTVIKITKNILPEEDKILFKLFKSGDENARDKIITKYHDWVVNIAKKYCSIFPSIEINELIAEGNRGLLEAMQHFDFLRPIKFSTYAWFWIIKNIQEFITTNNELIGVPSKIVSELRKIVNKMNDEIKKGKSPSLASISRKLDMDVDKVREWMSDKSNMQKPVSLDKYLNEDDHETMLSDMVEDKSSKNMMDLIDKADSDTNIVGILKQLSSIEQEIIRLRFGFEDNCFNSLKSIGEKLKLSPVKVKDLESVAIKKLKKYLSNSIEENNDK